MLLAIQGRPRTKPMASSMVSFVERIGGRAELTFGPDPGHKRHGRKMFPIMARQPALFRLVSFLWRMGQRSTTFRPTPSMRSPA